MEGEKQRAGAQIGDNISETRTYTGNVTMEGLQELTNALSNGTIP